MADLSDEVPAEAVPRSTLRLEPSGDLDMWSADELDGLVARFSESACTDVLLDLAQVPFIDPMGLRSLVSLHDVAASRGGVVTVVGDGEGVREILQSSGLCALVGVPERDDEAPAEVDLSLLAAARPDDRGDVTAPVDHP